MQPVNTGTRQKEPIEEGTSGSGGILGLGSSCPLDCALGERNPEMAGLAELVVVEPDEGRDGLLHRRQLHQRHLTVLREELECLDTEVDGIESLLEVVLLDTAGDVGEVERGGGRVDVLVVLAAGLLEPVKAGIAVVFRQAGVGLPVFR